MNVVDASLYVLADMTLLVLAVVVGVLLVDDRMGEIIPRLSRAVPCLTRFYRDRKITATAPEALRHDGTMPDVSRRPGATGWGTGSFVIT